MKKQVVIFAFCALCCGLFVLYSDPALEAARQGFYLWRDAVPVSYTHLIGGMRQRRIQQGKIRKRIPQPFLQCLQNLFPQEIHFHAHLSSMRKCPHPMLR